MQLKIAWTRLKIAWIKIEERLTRVEELLTLALDDLGFIKELLTPKP